MRPDPTTAASAGVPINEAARLLGVPMPTLRSWELRYGLPAGRRRPGTHRRYSPEDLHGLRLMRDEIARGKQASVAAASVRSLLGLAGPAADLVAAIMTASDRGDPDAVRRQLSRAKAALGLAGCLDDVLMPALKQVGLWWQAGRCDVEQERLTTEAARAWLESMAAFAPPPTRAHPIVLAAGVVVVSHLNTGRQRAVTALRAVEQMKVPVFYAGNAFITERSRRAVPGVYLGTRLEQARDLIDVTLTLDTDRSRGDFPGRPLS